MPARCVYNHYGMAGSPPPGVGVAPWNGSCLDSAGSVSVGYSGFGAYVNFEMLSGPPCFKVPNRATVTAIPLFILLPFMISVISTTAISLWRTCQWANMCSDLWYLRTFYNRYFLCQFGTEHGINYHIQRFCGNINNLWVSYPQYISNSQLYNTYTHTYTYPYYYGTDSLLEFRALLPAFMC